MWRTGGGPGVTVAVFLLAVPPALLIGPAAVWWWLVLIPVEVWLGRGEAAASG
ncbi:hypothetical protein [Streptomyces sp. M2CJ-2]|uniref:hypothetical protein n=1 Tax=Streptomyces sp. M2CJ-2 TaxID=2803948 RepID=UPI001F3C9EDC|nr:hypothetical protein [Streptomyces sp. M2CJ-2]